MERVDREVLAPAALALAVLALAALEAQVAQVAQGRRAAAVLPLHLAKGLQHPQLADLQSKVLAYRYDILQSPVPFRSAIANSETSQPSYGGGRYYGGGATTPYRAGVASPLGIGAIALTAGALAFYPGIWLYGAYAYPYSHPYTFRNHSATNSTNSTSKSTRDLWINALVVRQDTGVNETKPVTCLCAMYAECGCDDNGNSTFLDSIIGDGSYANLNKSLVDVADINGTSTIVLNGTLPNGTTTAGGTEDANGARRMIEASGYWVMIALVGCTVLLV